MGLSWLDVVPRKPHPVGNKYDSICCGVSGIMYAIELVKGKDSPPELAPENFSEHRKTTSLLLRLTESIHHSRRVVIMDSGFCVLQILVELASSGVYLSTVIKKRRYWPKYVNGRKIDLHFDFKEVGQTDSLPGTLDRTHFKAGVGKYLPRPSIFGICRLRSVNWYSRTVKDSYLVHTSKIVRFL